MTRTFRTSRTVVTLAAALPLLLGGCTVSAQQSEPANPAPVTHTTDDQGSLDTAVRDIEAATSTRVGIAALNTVTGESYEHRAEESFALCSTFKTYAVAEVLRRARAGTTSLDKPIRIERDRLVPKSPVTEPAAETSLTLAQLAEAALTASDNTAANYLLAEIGGPPAVTALARDIGDDATRLDRWEIELNTALRGDPRDTSTPGELAEGYEKLVLGDGLAPEDRELLTGWMRASKTSDTRIRAALPEGWSAADKTGGGDYGTVNDAGVVWTPDGDPVVLVFFTDTTTGRQDAPNNNQVIADATALVIDALATD